MYMYILDAEHSVEYIDLNMSYLFIMRIFFFYLCLTFRSGIY